MRQLTATILSSAIGLAGIMVAPGNSNLAAQAASTTMEFDGPGPSNAPENNDCQPGFSTAPTEAGDCSPPAVTPAVSEASPPAVPQAAAADAHDADPVDVAKVNAAEAPVTEKPAPAPAVQKAATVEDCSVAKSKCAALPPDTTQQATPTNKYARSWGLGGIIVNPIKAMFAAPGEMYRASVNEFHSGLNDLTNNGSKRLLVMPAAMLTLPFSIAAGCAEGASSAIKYERTGEPAPAKVAGARSTLTE
jgi:hypothetical protein